MVSPLLLRLRNVTLTLAVGIVAAGAIPTAATAAPGSPPPNPDPVQRYKDLGTQAAQANEDLLAAQNDLAIDQAKLQRAKAELARAQQVEQRALAAQNEFRGQVDNLTAASFEGVRLNAMTALLTGTSVRDYLDRVTLLREVAQDNSAALAGYQAATDQAVSAQRQAQDSQQRAQDATNTAAQLVSTITARKQALQVEITRVRTALNALTVPQRRTLSNVGDTGAFLGPTGVLNTVLQAALSRRGDPYVWGGAGPNSFDCSGLTMWAYTHGGISLPHSAEAQYGFGQSVPYGQWRAGDLLFFGSSPSTIHHVAMYVANGEIVQAPTEGVPVQVVPISGAGNDYFAAKRIVG